MFNRNAKVACVIVFSLVVSGCAGMRNDSSPLPQTPQDQTSGAAIDTQVQTLDEAIAPAGVQALWIANGTNVLEFTPYLYKTGVVNNAPYRTNNSPAFGAPQGVQFDKNGNLWVIDGGTVAGGGKIPPALDEFTPAQLKALTLHPKPLPFRQIKYSGFKFIQQAVFDANGNFWVTDNGANAVYKYDPAQLAAGGANVIPDATLTSSPAFTGPLGIAFGANGNLWIANNGTTTLFEFNRAALPLSGKHVLHPNVVLSDNGHGSIQGPWALVFDSAGNLWSSNANAPDTVVAFANANLKTSGKPTPSITIQPTIDGGFNTLSSPNGIAFNSSGDLNAVSSLAPFGLAQYNPFFHSGKDIPYRLIVGNKTTLNAPAGNEYGPVY